MLHGFNTVKARNNSRGGRVNLPGSLFTVPLPQPEGIQIAYEFGLRQDPKPAILIIKLPEDVFHQLEASNAVFSRLIAGQENTIETVFLPQSFSTLNQRAEFPAIIDPYSPR